MGDSSPGQYDREAYITMDFEDSTYVDCPECMGAGCSHCDDLGYHLSNEFDMFDSEPEEAPRGGIANDFMALDTATGRQRPTDRDGNEIPNDIDSYQKPNKYDDLHGNDSSVNDFDSISSGFDDDMDGIRKGLDADEFDKSNYFNDISRKGDDMGYDIKYFRSKTDVRGGDTITKPGTKDPIVKPKTPPKRGPWTKPTTVPNPQTTPKAVKEGNNTPKPKRLGRKGFYK